ncbi:MAG: caspase family protein [Candidatus Competibacter sp.]|nr:caspase family protein [Candidatus Competibacter sp.]
MTTVLKSKHPKIRLRIAALALIAMGLAQPLMAEAASRRYALLVGVGEYADKAKPKLKLEGPPNDVRAMAQALKKWGFDRITVLQDDKATRVEILKALDDLAKDAPAGSHVLFYFSGHGTSSEDPTFGKDLALPHTAGALVPYDARREGDAAAQRHSLIIGREDLRPRFQQLDNKGVYLTAWIDACFSENSTHTLAGLTSRAAPGFNLGDFGSGSAGYQPYPYQNAVTFAASAANQSAADIDQDSIRKFPTADGHFHGAFSDALLRALNDSSLPEYGPLDKNGDGVVSVDEFANGVTSFMASRAYGHQPKLQPLSVEDSRKSRSKPLFLADGRSQDITPAPIPAVKPVPAPPVSPTLLEPQRRAQLLDRIANTAQQSGRATVVLELAHPYATSRLPIGDKDHCVKVDLAYKADQPGYPLVIDRFGDGTVQWLYPLAGADDRQQQEQWQQPVPAGQAKTLWTTRTTPPPGVDTVYTLLLDRPLPPEAITSTYQIESTDGARFDLLLDALAKVRVLGAHRLALEIYQPQKGELQSWPKKTCQ